jgi:hypothetical protein
MTWVMTTSTPSADGTRVARRTAAATLDDVRITVRHAIESTGLAADDARFSALLDVVEVLPEKNITIPLPDGTVLKIDSEYRHDVAHCAGVSSYLDEAQIITAFNARAERDE